MSRNHTKDVICKTTHGTVLDVVDDLEQVLVLLGAPLVFVDMTENSEKSQNTVNVYIA